MRPPVTVPVAVLAALALAACGGSASTSSHAAASGSTRSTPSAPASASGSGTTSAGGSSTTASSSAASTPTSYEGVPLESGPAIAPASTTQTGTVDGIRCGPTEQLAYHIHAHLTMFVRGRMYSLPAGIGIPGSTTQQTAQGPVAAGGQCIYWLHTHTSDGVIHIESPTQRIYTLGNFFDEWQQPLTGTRAGTVRGHITAFVSGREWKKSPRRIPLIPHALIQLNIGAPAGPQVSVSWAQTGL